MPRDQETFADPHLNSLLPAVTPSRRGFIAASGSLGFALAAGPVNAQAIRTPADGLQVMDIQVPVSGGQMMPAYMSAPAKAGKYPVILVIPEVFGMHEYQKDITRRLAKLGYVGVTLDPFFRMGDLSRMTDIGAVVRAANSLQDAQMLSDLDSVVISSGNNPGRTFPNWASRACAAAVARCGCTPRTVPRSRQVWPGTAGSTPCPRPCPRRRTTWLLR